jgi:hypothetical protein
LLACATRSKESKAQDYESRMLNFTVQVDSFG